MTGGDYLVVVDFFGINFFSYEIGDPITELGL